MVDVVMRWVRWNEEQKSTYSVLTLGTFIFAAFATVGFQIGKFIDKREFWRGFYNG